MRIKKHPTGNQYLLTKHGVWVRDFLSPVAPLDINNLATQADFSTFFENEVINERNDVATLDLGSIKFNSAVIVSDGFKFKDKLSLLANLPSNIAVIATNRTLVKWNIDRKIDFFLVNNPYRECMNFMPSHRYYPRCVVSTRTHPKFIETYKERGGVVLSYLPTPEANYSSPCRTVNLDDYRNPICASIHLAYRLGVTKLLFFCCDDSFDSERPAAIRLENNLWTYPQHLISHGLIDGMCYWYGSGGKRPGIKIGNHSSGPFYDNAPYIQEEEICKFFE
jgi:hypothetical protein